MKRSARKTREDWLAAALVEIGSGGIDALRIDALANRLAVTKGSFYWHFRDREDLIRAAIAQWEQEATTEIHSLLEGLPSAEARLKRLVGMCLAETPGNALLRALSRIEDPRVSAAIGRVTRARLAYLGEQYEQLGMTKPDARMQALAAYSSYLGHLSLPSALRGGTRYARWLARLLVPTS